MKILMALAIFCTLLIGFAATTQAAELKYYNYEHEEVSEEVEENEYIFRTSANLNLRQGPGTNYNRIVLIPSGSTVEMLEFNPDGFSRISFNGNTGYAYSEFIRQSVVGGARVDGAVEKLHWSYVRTIMPTGTILQIYDVLTGEIYYVSNFSNGSHADVRPLTRNDTDTLRRTYGGRWSWDPRPVIVTFNGRSVAAAINGMPHGGSSSANNGMNGHVCLHFYGSRTHNGNRNYEREMQAAVARAARHQ